MAEELNDFGTLESFLLKLVIEAGHKPIFISQCDGEEVFVFRSEEEAEIAALDFEPEGIWLDADTFDSIKDDYEVDIFEVPVEMAMTAEERILRAEEIKRGKLDEFQKKVLKVTLGAEIQMAKSCETCKNCISSAKDKLRICDINKVSVSGHSTCKDWEKNSVITRGGIRNFRSGERFRKRELGLQRLKLALETVGEDLTVINRGREFVYQLKDGNVVFCRRTPDGSLTTPYRVQVSAAHDKVLLSKDLSKLF